jgi:hypothetical protein
MAAAMNIFEQMNRMYLMIPNPARFVMSDETYRQFVTEADQQFRLQLQPGQTIESRFAGIPVEIDSTVPPGQVYLLGRTSSQ